MADVVETRIATMWLDEDGFVHVRYKADVTMELDDVGEFGDRTLELTGGVPGWIVSDLGLKGATSEARTYAAGPEHAAKIAAVGAFGMNAVGRLIATVFMRLQRPPFPMRLFADEDEAKAWLLRMRGDRAA